MQVPARQGGEGKESTPPSAFSIAEPFSESDSATIVVVDDQEAVLEFCRVTLEGAGYRVFAASSGEQALRFFEPNRSRVDLTLIDLVMPGMSGIELAKRLERLNTGVGIVLMSGYAPDEVKHVVTGRAAQYPCMWKPFEARTLVQMIRNALDADLPKPVLVDQAEQAGT